MSYLIDTNIISELCRRVPDAAVVRWAERIEQHQVSAVTVEEIWFGVAKRPDPRLRAWMDRYFQQHRVLLVDELIAQRAGELRGEFARRGIVRTQADRLIAATAQVHALILVTRNTRDFEGCGISLLNPFERTAP